MYEMEYFVGHSLFIFFMFLRISFFCFVQLFLQPLHICISLHPFLLFKFGFSLLILHWFIFLLIHFLLLKSFITIFYCDSSIVSIIYSLNYQNYVFVSNLSCTPFSTWFLHSFIYSRFLQVVWSFHFSRISDLFFRRFLPRNSRWNDVSWFLSLIKCSISFFI